MIFETIEQNFGCRAACNRGHYWEAHCCEIHAQLQGCGGGTDEKTDCGENTKPVLLSCLVLQSQPQRRPKTLYQFPEFPDKNGITAYPQLVGWRAFKARASSKVLIRSIKFQQKRIYISALFMATSLSDDLQWQVLFSPRGTRLKPDVTIYEYSAFRLFLNPLGSGEEDESQCGKTIIPIIH